MKQKRNPLTWRRDLVWEKNSTPLHLEVVDQLPETWEDWTLYIVEWALYSTMYVWDSSTNAFVKVWTTKISLQEQSDWAEEDPTDVTYIKNKPILAPVATSNDYEDLDNKPDVNTRAFYLQSVDDLETGQAILDWYLAWNFPISVLDWQTYVFWWKWHSSEYETLTFYRCAIGRSFTSYSYNVLTQSVLIIRFNNNRIARISTGGVELDLRYLAPWINYQVPYTPEYDGSPATKKYVDNKSTYVGTTAPSDATEWTLWYDTANDVLMSYDWANWNPVWGGSGDGDVKGPVSSVDWHIAVFDWTTGKIIKDSWLNIQNVNTEPTWTRVDVYYNNWTIYLFSSLLGWAILAENWNFLVTEDDKDIVLES